MLYRNVNLHFFLNIIQIYYSALNFRDIMLASGKLSNDVVGHSRLTQECVQGFEFSGKTKE